ncbi:protein C10-like [Oppia nitens]|uniref:protein C10-like n=1 Tax=Oppia nitens TaxID=1686743 RepID=UPI0023DAB10E|nr:protein C10-like [Oppia nitens]
MASSSSNESAPQLSRSEAKIVLNQVIRAINETNNTESSAGLPSDSSESDYCIELKPQMDAVKHMRYMFPMSTQILMNVISNYGFSKSGEGVIQFYILVRKMERFDEEIKRLNTQLKSFLLPTLCFTPLATNSSVI